MCFESQIEKPSVSFLCTASHLKDASKPRNHCCCCCFIPSYITLEESWPVQGRVEEGVLEGKFIQSMCEFGGQRELAQGMVLPPTPSTSQKPHVGGPVSGLAGSENRGGLGRRKYFFLGCYLGLRRRKKFITYFGAQLGVT